MTHNQFNQLMRFVLVGSVVIIVGFLIVAAQPIPRYRGSFYVRVGETAPILDEWNRPIATVKITHSAVVTFPQDWKISDLVCMVMRYERGTAETTQRFEDQIPQTLWDQRSDESLLVLPGDVSARATNGAQMLLIDPDLMSRIETRLGFRVHWFGLNTLALEKNQASERLLCYNFGADGVLQIPFEHLVRFGVANAALSRMPAFYLTTNADPADKQPQEAYLLPKMEIGAYLTQLVIDGVSVVKPMNAAQLEQRATERAKSP